MCWLTRPKAFQHINQSPCWEWFLELYWVHGKGLCPCDAGDTCH